MNVPDRSSVNALYRELIATAAASDVDGLAKRAISVAAPVDRLVLLFLILDRLDRLIDELRAAREAVEAGR